MVKTKIKRYNKILSLEISEGSIAAVEIQFGKNGIHITNGFYFNNPTFQDVDQTVNLLRENIKAHRITTKDCIVGFSMQYFKFFPIPIPLSIPEDEIDSIVIQEGNINLDKQAVVWNPLNNTRREDVDGVKRVDVLGIATDKNLIDFSKLISQVCRLKMLSVTPSFYGLGIFLDEKVERNLSATLSISQIRSEFVIWLGQEPIYEHLFLTHQLKDQVFQSVNQVQSQLSGVQLESIYAVGSFVKDFNLTQLPYKIQSLKLPPDFYDTGKVLNRINSYEIISPIGLALAVSNNMNYSVPNLLSSVKLKQESVAGIFKDFAKAQVKSQKNDIPFFGILNKIDPIISKFILLSVAVLSFSILANLFIQNVLMPGVMAKQTVLGNKLNLAQFQINKLLDYEKTNKILIVKSDFYSRLIEKRDPWSKILKEIASMTPKGLWIDRIEIRNNTILVFGRSVDVDSVANFSINLNHTAQLLGKTKIIALRKTQEDGVDIVEFELTAQIIDQKQQLTNLSGKQVDTERL